MTGRSMTPAEDPQWDKATGPEGDVYVQAEPGAVTFKVWDAKRGHRSITAAEFEAYTLDIGPTTLDHNYQVVITEIVEPTSNPDAETIIPRGVVWTGAAGSDEAARQEAWREFEHQHGPSRPPAIVEVTRLA